MEKKICQSCGMPLDNPDYHSTNADGSINTEYCNYCYDKGNFVDGCNTLEEKIEQCVEAAVRGGMKKTSAEDMAKSILPNLGRWS